MQNKLYHSYIGMSSVEMPASSMIFKLSEAANELESIVVVGYGTLSKKN
jgi:hypothetical protein